MNAFKYNELPFILTLVEFALAVLQQKPAIFLRKLKILIILAIVQEQGEALKILQIAKIG